MSLEARRSEAVSHRSAKILVIEDDAAMRSLICEFLELQGHDVLGFDLATRALKEIKSWIEHDLVISDLNMPEMTGIELIQRVQDLAPHIPVILISAFGTQQAEVQALKNGAVGFLNKPFKLSDLLERVARALGSVRR